MNFPARLKQLRRERGLTQLQVATALGVVDRTLRKYEVGEIAPTLPVLIALADFFGVSLDYLAGRTDRPEVNR